MFLFFFTCTPWNQLYIWYVCVCVCIECYPWISNSGGSATISLRYKCVPLIVFDHVNSSYFPYHAVPCDFLYLEFLAACYGIFNDQVCFSLSCCCPGLSCLSVLFELFPSPHRPLWTTTKYWFGHLYTSFVDISGDFAYFFSDV